MTDAFEKCRRDKRERTLKIVKKTVLYFFMVLLAVYMLLPFYWSILTSFRLTQEIQQIPVKLYPTSFTLEHYKYFFEQMDVFAYIGNTLFVIAMIIVFSLLFCCLGGYSLAKLEYRGKGIVVKLMYASMMIPGIISLIPQFFVVMSLGLVGNLFGIIVPAMFSVYGVLFMRSFFLSTPTAVAEAARIDGAGEFRIFASLYIPMVLPGLLTLGLFTFNSNWNSYLWPSLIIGNSDELMVMSVAIKSFQILTDDYGPIMASSVITIIPSLIIFIVGQKFFMDNMTFAGIK